jgi:hypothetical protein
MDVSAKELKGKSNFNLPVPNANHYFGIRFPYTGKKEYDRAIADSNQVLKIRVRFRICLLITEGLFIED